MLYTDFTEFTLLFYVPSLRLSMTFNKETADDGGGVEYVRPVAETL